MSIQEYISGKERPMSIYAAAQVYMRNNVGEEMMDPRLYVSDPRIV